MSREIYHPANAVANPKAYYDEAFKNYPKPLVVSMVGRAATLLTRPEVSYHNADNEADYLSKFDKDSSIVLTFTHRGHKNLHDPISAAAAVFGSEFLLERVKNIRVWAASPYMTSPKFSPVIVRLGSVPVNRAKDYADYGMNPTESERQQVLDELIDHSVNHLEDRGNTLVIFPAGTKGGSTTKDGVGLVLERLSDTVTIPIAMVSDTETSSNLPRNLRIAYGEPVMSLADRKAADYVSEIDRSIKEATASVGG